MRKEIRPFFVIITFQVLIYWGLFGGEKKGLFVSKGDLQRETFGIRKYFQPERGPYHSWVPSPAPLLLSPH